MESQIPRLTIVYLTVYSGADQREYQSSASLAFVPGIHRWPVNSPRKRPVTRKMFPFDDVIMTSKTKQATTVCMFHGAYTVCWHTPIGLPRVSAMQWEKSLQKPSGMSARGKLVFTEHIGMMDYSSLLNGELTCKRIKEIKQYFFYDNRVAHTRPHTTHIHILSETFTIDIMAHSLRCYVIVYTTIVKHTFSWMICIWSFHIWCQIEAILNIEICSKLTKFWGGWRTYRRICHWMLILLSW